MIHPLSLALLAGAAFALAACEADPPSVDTADITAFNAEAARTAALPVTPFNDLPAGTVTYTGAFGSDAAVDGDDSYAILGDMEMTINFGNQDVNGDLSQVNLIQNGTPEQEMDGTLDIDGQAVNGVIDATASGTLTRVDTHFFGEYTSVDLDMNGSVRNDVFVGDAVAGTVSGGSTGSIDTFNLELDGNGNFYGSVVQ